MRALLEAEDLAVGRQLLLHDVKLQKVLDLSGVERALASLGLLHVRAGNTVQQIHDPHGVVGDSGFVIDECEGEVLDRRADVPVEERLHPICDHQTPMRVEDHIGNHQAWMSRLHPELGVLWPLVGHASAAFRGIHARKVLGSHVDLAVLGVSRGTQDEVLDHFHSSGVG